MISKFTLLFFILSSQLHAFDKDLKAINDRVPYEFNLMYEALKLEIKTPSEKLRMIALSKDLNDNLGFLQKEHIFLLMKSEVIKTTLENKFDKVRQFDVNALLIARLEQVYETKKRYLNSFSKFIWQSVLAELNHRKQMGLITTTGFSPNKFEGVKRAEAIRFQRYLIYLFPWIDKMDSLEASAFNKLSKEVSWNVLQRINERSLLFKRYASSANGDKMITIINIPQKLLDLKPDDIKKMQNDTQPLTLAEQAVKAKSEAGQDIDKVTPLDMSTMSDDVAKELEQNTKPLQPTP